MTVMKYIFVLQWPASSIDDYDSMVAIENLLISALSKNSNVDGHDIGAGETNIFIETDDPNGLYEEIKSALGSHGAWSYIRVAYRNTEGGAYMILWPKNLRDFRVR
jgi:hypothetical protein